MGMISLYLQKMIKIVAYLIALVSLVAVVQTQRHQFKVNYALENCPAGTTVQYALLSNGERSIMIVHGRNNNGSSDGCAAVVRLQQTQSNPFQLKFFKNVANVTAASSTTPNSSYAIGTYVTVDSTPGFGAIPSINGQFNEPLENNAVEFTDIPDQYKRVCYKNEVVNVKVGYEVRMEKSESLKLSGVQFLFHVLDCSV